MIEIRNLKKVYKGAEDTAAIDGISLTVGDRGLVFFLGRSGSGKTTLLNLIGGLDGVTEGDILVDGVSLKSLDQKRLDSYRSDSVGFVFQDYGLLEELTVEENVALSLSLKGQKDTADAVEKILDRVGLSGLGKRKPGELSGGQKQRVAIARALVKDPRIIAADEPTGALDSDTAEGVWELLRELSCERTVIAVSHDRNAAERFADRIVELSDGRVVSDSAQVAPEKDVKAEMTGERRSRLPLSTTFKTALSTAATKKFRLAITVILSVVAFLLVAVADAFSAYSYYPALKTSLFENGTASVALKKEKAIDYGSGETWYNDGFKMTDREIASLCEKTGVNVKGVYLPQNGSMQIEDNYSLTEVTYDDYHSYVSSLAGFAEVEEKELCDFGMELVAGTMPSGDADEVALSKYVFESFCIAGYRRYTGPLLELQNEKISIPWDEFRHYSYETLQELLPFLVRSGQGVVDLDTCEVTEYEDLIGKTVFLGDRNFTVTGIVDTHFDPSRYKGVKPLEDGDASAEDKDLFEIMRSGEFETERSYGAEMIAFVGKGKVAEIASRFPNTTGAGNGSIELTDGDRKYEIKSFARLSDLGEASASLYFYDAETVGLTGKKVMAPVGARAFFEADENGNVHTMKNDEFSARFAVSVSYGDDRRAYYSKGYQCVGYSAIKLYYGSELYDIDNVMVVSDEVFDTLTEGRGGTWAFAIAGVPDTESGISRFVDAVYSRDDSCRYSVTTPTTYQMNTFDSFIGNAAKICGIVGWGLTLFAAVMIFYFISGSIESKKREIGIMRAMGAGRGDVFGIFMFESLFLATVTALVSLAAAFVLTGAANSFFADSYGLLFPIFDIGARQVGLTVLVAFGATFLSSFIPTGRISRMKPIDAIR